MFALAMVLALTGSALAVTQQRLFRTVDHDRTFENIDPEANGAVLIQQHSVFVEIIAEEINDLTTFQQYAAVVGLVKKCRQTRNVFDNAVLWFNDQFLFGNKSNRTLNVTPPNAMGRNPNRTIAMSDLLDPNRNNGTSRWLAGPNYELIALRASDQTPSPGQSVILTARVRNTGTEALPPTLVTFRIGGDTLDGQTGWLAPGEHSDVPVTWTAVPGDYTARAMADAADQLAETDETDNDAVIAINGPDPNPPVPDLEVTQIVVINEDDPAGARFEARVHNAGAAAGPSQTRFVVDGVDLVGDVATGPLGANEIVVVASPVWPAKAGTHEVTVTADAADEVFEALEANNERRQTFIVTGTAVGVADLEVTAIKLTPERPRVGDPVQVTATIRNNGIGATPTSTRFVLDGVEHLGDATTPGISFGASVDVLAPLVWTAVGGPHEVSATADVDHELGELSESNNQGTLAFSLDGKVAVAGNGTGPNEGGNPDRDGFIRARDFRERWGGCFIPRGFMHGIAADDPYSVGELARTRGDVSDAPILGDAAWEGTIGLTTNASAHGSGNIAAFHAEPRLEICDNICIVKALITLDNHCACGLFTYVGSFFITDPNNHRWIVDEFLYPVDFAGVLDDDPTNCHPAVFLPDDPPDDPFDDPAPEPILNHCSRELERPQTYGGSSEFEETDRPQKEDPRFTTKEILLTVHIQVDPWSPDRQGFPDEAIWAYREDGKLRLGLPYTEEPDHFCHDEATVVAGAAAAYEYDFIEDEGTRKRAVTELNATLPDDDPADSRDPTFDWSEFRRGPVGNTVECAIEYNFLLAAFFESYDNLPSAELLAVAYAGNTQATANVRSQEEGRGENEIIRNYTQHGNGGANDGDPSWAGNSHPHNPRECQWNPSTNTTTCATCPNPGPCSEPDPGHPHDALVLDIFFFPKAPLFTMENPYWDHYNDTDAILTHGTPPAFIGVDAHPHDAPDECIPAPSVKDPGRRAALLARRTIVCDPDAVDGFHFHDGTHSLGPTPPTRSLKEQVERLP